MSLLPVPRGVDDLPTELLSHIFGYLDSPAPSIAQLREQPSATFAKSDTSYLKAISTVSKRWRQIVLPRLFAHARLPITAGAHAFDDQHRVLSFIRDSKLTPYVKTWLVCFESPEYNDEDAIRPGSDGIFWANIFNLTNPTAVTLLGPAKMLGVLMGYSVDDKDVRYFDNVYHVFSLQQPKHENGRFVGNQRPLLMSRPWTHVLLNEGSYIKVYADAESFLRKTCSILPSLLRDLSRLDDGSPSSTIRDMSYIAAFPLTSHFINFSQHFPPLHRLFVQLVPWAHLLRDRHVMSRVVENDLWVERNGCYAALVHQLFRLPALGNFRYLQHFESGDAADQDAWNMAVEYVNMMGAGWVVEGDGIFARSRVPSRGEQTTPTPPENIDGEAEAERSVNDAMYKI